MSKHSVGQRWERTDMYVNSPSQAPMYVLKRFPQGILKKTLQKEQHILIEACANDPSAGSPTETLLRLLLPLSDKVH